MGSRLTSKDNDEMLRQDLMLEYELLKRYYNRIKNLESFSMFNSAHIIGNTPTQEHINELKTALGIEKNIATRTFKNK